MNSDFSMLSILVFSCLIQFYLGFANPAFNEGNKCWRPITQVVESKEVDLEGTDADKRLVQRFARLFPYYQMNCDDGYFLRLLQRGFPKSFEKFPVLIDQPFYPFLVFLLLKPVGLLIDTKSMSVIFAVAVIANLLMLMGGVALFYRLLNEIISSQVAFLSGLLLVFSPLVHIWLVQSTSTGIMEIFIIIMFLYLLNRYRMSPSPKRLVIFSLLAGILMTGKMIFALGFFVMCLGWYYKRISESVLFGVIHLIPFGLWYLYVEWILDIPFGIATITDYHFGIWLIDLFSMPWNDLLLILTRTIPRYFQTVVEGFFLLPVILSLYGLHCWQNHHKYQIYILYTVSFMALFFIMNYFIPRLSFFLFPIIYPTAVVGLQKLPHARFFSPVIYAAIIIISNINVYKILEYG
ncbi:MAG: hypothetical protein QGH96_03030 [Desulfobacterales bacterium]|jgi:hypothetical protein|nr:hypothetical protein [Desulfobacterales bacterium]|tara:strand:+ start:27616 stop:28836 length:1221 start_codon:yes stop_codon:yes gene_type:complete